MRSHLAVFALALTLAPALPAWAQLVLPGAAPSSAPPSVPPPAGGKPGGGGQSSPDAKVVTVKPPGEETIVGRVFQRNGSAGQMSFEKSGADLRIGRLAFVGYQLSKPTEVCRVEVGGGIELTPVDRREGLLSFEAKAAACPFSVDVLDGAVRVRGRTCDFAAADCRVDPAGVWGPAGSAISADEAKNIEKLRAKAETEARGAFRALLAAHKGDKIRIKSIAADQASFSSVREEICRDYSREDQHGFCSARITMAHAVALSAELRGPSAAGDAAPEKKKRPKPKPRPPAPLPSAGAAPPIQ